MEKINTLTWDGEKLWLLDQRALPREKRYICCCDAAEVSRAISNMAVRGAPAIGVAAAFALVMAAQKLVCIPEISSGGKFDWPLFLDRLAGVGAALTGARPTAVNLAWGVGRMLEKARGLAGTAAGEVPARLDRLARDIYEEDIVVNKRIGQHGAFLLPTCCCILTHCNAGALATAGYGTALGVIRSAVAAGKDIRVFADETRPFLQGARLTAWELQQEGIPVTLIADSAAGYFLARREIDCVIVGADRIAANGDVANKIGTYMLAVLADRHRVPFYVAAPRSTFDPTLSCGEEVKVEERDGREITHWGGVAVAPPGVAVRNPSFDITPANLITAIITEDGPIHRPGRTVIGDFLGGGD